jgi:hypothetical protein
MNPQTSLTQTRTPSLKTQCRQAIKAGNTELALEMLKGLENPKPIKLKKPSPLDKPYYCSFIYKKP